MKNGRLICVNSGKCHEAGVPVSQDARPGSPCQQCGQPFVKIKDECFPLSFFWGIAVIYVYGLLVVFWGLRLERGRDSKNYAHAGAGIMGIDLQSFDASIYFTKSLAVALLDNASKGDRASVRRMLLEKPELLRHKVIGKITTLQAELYSQDATAFETLLEEEFDPNVQTRKGINSLMAAAMHPNSLFLAAAFKKTGLVPQQTDYKRGDALFLAVVNHQSGNIRRPLQRGADLNCRDSCGNTALMATFQGRCPTPDALMLLLQAGAVPSMTDKIALNARDFATYLNDPEILALLP